MDEKYAWRYFDTFTDLTKEEKRILIKALLDAVKWGNKIKQLCQEVKH